MSSTSLEREVGKHLVTTGVTWHLIIQVLLSNLDGTNGSLSNYVVLNTRKSNLELKNWMLLGLKKLKLLWKHLVLLRHFYVLELLVYTVKELIIKFKELF